MPFHVDRRMSSIHLISFLWILIPFLIYYYDNSMNVAISVFFPTKDKYWNSQLAGGEIFLFTDLQSVQRRPEDRDISASDKYLFWPIWQEAMFLILPGQIDIKILCQTCQVDFAIRLYLFFNVLHLPSS